MKHKPKAIGDIAKFDSLRYEDQKRIRERFASANGTAAPGNFLTEYCIMNVLLFSLADKNLTVLPCKP